MKKYYSIILGLLFSFSIQMANGQCTISNLSIETEDCIEANVYSFTFNFNIAENPSNLFDLYMNGEYYDSYEIEDLPITINEFSGSSSGIDTFLVCANDADNCCADMLIESPCSCDYFNVQTEVNSCTEDSLWYSLDFDYVNVSDSFLMGTPGLFLGTFHVNELPLEVGPFPRSLSPAEVLISNQNDIFCFEPYIINDEACDQCNITNLMALAGECNEDGEFYVTLSFEYMNISEDGFKVAGNGNFYGEFMYEDSILMDNGLFMDSLVIGPLPGDCETNWEFQVWNNGDEGCSDFEVLGPICCEPECEIRDIQVSEVECQTLNTISFVLDFIYENPANDFFHVYSGDQPIGMFDLEDLPLVIEDFPINEGETTLTVCINDTEECCAQFVFEPIDCSEEICDIYDLVIDEIECTSTETISFYLDFESQNTGDNFFELYSNDEIFGYFPLTELPLLIEDFPIGVEGTVLTVCINDMENCCEEFEFSDLDCSDFECEIGEISYDIDFIDTDSFLVFINFEHSGTDMEQFSVHGNGLFYGDFIYGALPIIFGPYNCHDSIALEFIIRDLQYTDCESILKLGIIGCPMNTTRLNFDAVNVYSDNNYLMILDPKIELKNSKIALYSAIGQRLLTKDLMKSGEIHRIERGTVPPGIYFVEIQNQEKRQVYKINLN